MQSNDGRYFFAIYCVPPPASFKTCEIAIIGRAESQRKTQIAVDLSLSALRRKSKLRLGSNLQLLTIDNERCHVLSGHVVLLGRYRYSQLGRYTVMYLLTFYFPHCIVSGLNELQPSLAWNQV